MYLCIRICTKNNHKCARPMREGLPAVGSEQCRARKGVGDYQKRKEPRGRPLKQGSSQRTLNQNRKKQPESPCRPHTSSPVPRPRQVTRAKSEGARRNPSPSVTGSAVLHCEWLKPVYINPGTADSRPGGLGSRNVRPGQSNVEKVLPVDSAAAPTSAQMNRGERRER